MKQEFNKTTEQYLAGLKKKYKKIVWNNYKLS